MQDSGAFVRALASDGFPDPRPLACRRFGDHRLTRYRVRRNRPIDPPLETDKVAKPDCPNSPPQVIGKRPQRYTRVNLLNKGTLERRGSRASRYRAEPRAVASLLSIRNPGGAIRVADQTKEAIHANAADCPESCHRAQRCRSCVIPGISRNVGTADGLYA